MSFALWQNAQDFLFASLLPNSARLLVFLLPSAAVETVGPPISSMRFAGEQPADSIRSNSDATVFGSLLIRWVSSRWVIPSFSSRSAMTVNWSG